MTELEISRNEVIKTLDVVQQQHRSITTDSAQVQSLLNTNDHLLQEMASLKDTIEQLHEQIQQMAEREQMLLEYPDLNGPLEHGPGKNPAWT